MIRAHNTRWIGRAAITAVLLCVPAAWAQPHHSGAPAPHSATAPAAHASAPTAHSPRPQNQGRSGPQFQSRPQANAARRPTSGYPAPRPVGPVPAYPGPPYQGPGFSRPEVRGYAPPSELPQGHLGDWLNQHRNLPVQEQERMLRNDPSFHRLPPDEQQRVVRQLHQVSQLTEGQRQRRLARAAIIERLSPQEQMRINLSARRWVELPPERQATMKSAFRGSARAPAGAAPNGAELRPLPGPLQPRRARHPLRYAARGAVPAGAVTP